MILHYEVASLAIFLAIIVAGRKIVRHNFGNRPPFEFLDIVYDDPRVIFLSKLWFFTIVFTSTIGYLRYHQIPVFSESFYVSWCVNVIFFTVIGLAAALVSLRVPHKEEFASRLGILFAGRVEVDGELNGELKRTALSYISDDVKKLGFVYSSIDRKVTVEEFDKEYNAYRAFVTVKTTLVNLFGDVDATDMMNFSVTPDPFKKCAAPPETIGQIVSLIVDGKETLKDGPKTVLPIEGVAFPKPFTVGKESKSFVFKYWCWFEVDERADYTPSRFCRKISVRVVNRIKTGDIKTVNLRTESGESRELAYGEDWEVVEGHDLKPKVGHPLFTFISPSSPANLELESNPTIVNVSSNV